MALAKYNTGSSDGLAHGSRCSFVYAQDKLGVSSVNHELHN